MKDPHIVVLSTLFPNRLQPMAGLFVRERKFRVTRHFSLKVVAPVPWIPFQSLIRLIRLGFRPAAPGTETQGQTTVFHPRFFPFPVHSSLWMAYLWQ
jgi:hypothetical protein